MTSVRSALIMPIILLLISSCTSLQTPTANKENNTYNADTLAKDWREQVRKNPNNPYEGRGYPADNDSEYYSPKKRTTTKGQAKGGSNQQPSQRNMPAFEDNDDSSYGRFPRYNPDDDNAYPSESKDYPLYLD